MIALAPLLEINIVVFHSAKTKGGLVILNTAAIFFKI
jgi:hypothetical protein